MRRLLSVQDFAEWAAVANAVVFMSVAGSIVRNGQLQSLLSELHVPYTGSQTLEVQICADKACPPLPYSFMQGHAGRTRLHDCTAMTLQRLQLHCSFS